MTARGAMSDRTLTRRRAGPALAAIGAALWYARREAGQVNAAPDAAPSTAAGLVIVRSSWSITPNGSRSHSHLDLGACVLEAVARRWTRYPGDDPTTAPMPAGAGHLSRHVALLDGRSRVLVQDELEAISPVEVRWAMHTHAAIEIAADGRAARLHSHGQTLAAHLLSPAGARFRAEDTIVASPH